MKEYEKILFMIYVVYRFSSFGRCQYFYDVDPFWLEPFIAKYVRVINRCGMETFFSCDGWHKAPRKSREVTILFSDRYS